MEREVESSEQGKGESSEERKDRLRAEARALSEEMFSKETISHLVKASTEFILAVDSMIPREKIPPEVKEHYLNAKRESIMLLKCLLNAQLQTVEQKQEREGLQKIDLE